MFCKKCGTEQKDGQKFCPRCGEPFLDENGKPYLKGIKKDMLDAKDKLTSKAEKLTQQGKKLVDEKLQPQLNEKIEKIKTTDWRKKLTEASSYIVDFVKDINKMRIVTKILACISVLWFFSKVGFSASILWYVLIAAILFLAFKEPKAIKDGPKTSKFIYIGTCLVLILITAFGAPQKGSGNFSIWGSNSGGPREICISLKSDVSQGYGNNVSGNYGIVCAVAGYFTDVITIPQGKTWTFSKQEIEYSEKGGTQFHPDICYYNTGNTDATPIIYNCYTQAREIPVFRGNDKIRIRVKHLYAGNIWKPKSLEAKVYFVEKDDDLQISN